METIERVPFTKYTHHQLGPQNLLFLSFFFSCLIDSIQPLIITNQHQHQHQHQQQQEMVTVSSGVSSSSSIHLFQIIWCILVLIGVMVLKGCNGAWSDGHATYYGANENPTSLGGACGYDNTLHAGFGINTAALSGALFRGGEACGACFELRCNARTDPKWCLRRATVVVTATNFCPPNNHGGWCDPPRQHFDMSMYAFFRIARRGNEGIIPVIYRRVPCKRRGGVRFTLKGQSNFNMVMISNVGGGGAVKAAWIKGSRTRTWVSMHRNWGANWQSNIDLRSQRLSIRITLIDGRTLIFYNVVPSSWRFGQTFASRNQF